MTERESDEEYDIEETTLMVELQGIMENDFLAQVSQAKILGIDTEKPLLQLDDYTFCGQYSDTLGTNLIFQDTTDVNEASQNEKKLQYSCLTNKKLNLQRVFLKDNNDPTTQLNIAGVSSDEEQGEDVTSRSPKSPQGPAEFITDTTVDKTLNKDTEMIVDNVPTSEIMDVAESLPEGETDNVNNSMATLPSTSAEKTAMMDLYSSPDYKII